MKQKMFTNNKVFNFSFNNYVYFFFLIIYYVHIVCLLKVNLILPEDGPRLKLVVFHYMHNTFTFQLLGILVFKLFIHILLQ